MCSLLLKELFYVLFKHYTYVISNAFVFLDNFSELIKKSNLQLCQNYQPHQSFEQSHAEKLKPQAEEIIAEEQAGVRAGRSTTEQIFTLRIQ